MQIDTIGTLGGIALSAVLALAGCDQGSDDGNGADEAGEAGETGEHGIDEAAISAAAADYASYEAIAAAPFASQHGAAASVQIWVPDTWADAYRGIDPADPEASASFPEGAIILKEHLDGGGEATDLTVMVKGPPGYAPDSGDWWWGALELDGTIKAGGTLQFCVDCHAPRAGADWLFGVAPADQS